MRNLIDILRRPCSFQSWLHPNTWVSKHGFHPGPYLCNIYERLYACDHRVFLWYLLTCLIRFYIQTSVRKLVIHHACPLSEPFPLDALSPSNNSVSARTLSCKSYIQPQPSSIPLHVQAGHLVSWCPESNEMCVQPRKVRAGILDSQLEFDNSTFSSS